MRLLVIEDEPRIAEILKTALERAEFVVGTVRLCADAREALANTAYDAAVLDLGLPDGDGLDLIAELRRQDAKRIPILVLTARDTVRDRVCGLDAGADDYLVTHHDADRRGRRPARPDPRIRGPDAHNARHVGAPAPGAGLTRPHPPFLTGLSAGIKVP